MFFKFNAALIITALVSFQARASPTASSEDLVLLSTQETPTGTITIWGIPDEASKREAAALSPDQKRQCGSNTVVCSGSNTADINSCRQLINSLAANSGQGVGTSPRSICQSVNGNQCCVSWANPVSGLNQGDLVNAARDVLNQCGGNTVSGLTRNTNLNGICTTQCLSNRPNGCSN